MGLVSLLVNIGHVRRVLFNSKTCSQMDMTRKDKEMCWNQIKAITIL